MYLNARAPVTHARALGTAPVSTAPPCPATPSGLPCRSFSAVRGRRCPRCFASLSPPPQSRHTHVRAHTPSPPSPHPPALPFTHPTHVPSYTMCSQLFLVTTNHLARQRGADPHARGALRAAPPRRWLHSSLFVRPHLTHPLVVVPLRATTRVPGEPPARRLRPHTPRSCARQRPSAPPPLASPRLEVSKRLVPAQRHRRKPLAGCSTHLSPPLPSPAAATRGEARCMGQYLSAPETSKVRGVGGEGARAGRGAAVAGPPKPLPPPPPLSLGAGVGGGAERDAELWLLGDAGVAGVNGACPRARVGRRGGARPSRGVAVWCQPALAAAAHVADAARPAPCHGAAAGGRAHHRAQPRRNHRAVLHF